MPQFKGATALADYVHRALHTDGSSREQVREAIAGHRLALVERAQRIASGRHALSHAAPAKARWLKTSQFLFDEHAFNMEAYSSEPVQDRKRSDAQPRPAQQRKGRKSKGG